VHSWVTCFVDKDVDNIIASLKLAKKVVDVLDILMSFFQKRHDLSAASKSAKSHLTMLFPNDFCAEGKQTQGEARAFGKRKRDAPSSLRVFDSNKAERLASTPSQRPRTHGTQSGSASIGFGARRD
jgi:hypothetical protein